MALLCTLVCGGLVGCGSANLSEADLMTQLGASGLNVERLAEPTITSKQRDRLGAEPQTMFSIRVTDGSGSSQSMTLVQFDKDWKASAVGDEGVPGFAIQNWYFVGTVSQNIRNQIQAALL
jgi:hypothetical protein